MNIKYVPQKSEKFSFTGLLVGCVASILIFLLLSMFLVDMYVQKKNDEALVTAYYVYLIFSYFAIWLVTMFVDCGIFKLFHRFCNKKFFKAYITWTLLLGFYIKWAYASFFIHKNIDKSAKLLNSIIDPLFVLKETFTNFSFLDLVLELILLIIAYAFKHAAISLFKEKDVYCNNCNRWPDIIEFRLYTKDIELLSQKFNDDVNCLLNLPVIDVSLIEEKKHKEREREFNALGVEERDLIFESTHLKVQIHHCSTCNKLKTISIYRINYGGHDSSFITYDNPISPTYILTKEQFEAFRLKESEKRTDFIEILQNTKPV